MIDLDEQKDADAFEEVVMASSVGFSAASVAVPIAPATEKTDAAAAAAAAMELVLGAVHEDGLLVLSHADST